MKKKEKFKIEIVDDKEESSMGKWIPIGVMIGTAIGAMLSMVLDNILFLGGGATFGLLLGVMIGSIASEEKEEKEEQEEEKKK